MADPQRILTRPDSPRTSHAALAPAGLPDVAWIFLIFGLALALSGWVDVLLFYVHPQFGQNEWEFGTIAQTFDALPLPTMAMLLLAVGLRARGGRPIWTRLLALACILVTLFLLALLVIFLLDIPVAWRAMTRPPSAGGAPASPVIVSGLKRGIAKVGLFGIGYTTAYLAVGIKLWRAVRR